MIRGDFPSGVLHVLADVNYHDMRPMRGEHVGRGPADSVG